MTASTTLTADPISPPQAPGEAVKTPDLAARLAVFALWLGVALFLAARHVMWRDEVRAWSLAMSGRSVGEMLGAVHGEGHPALWYLLLRGAHALVPHPQAMPLVAFAVGSAAALIFALRAPFRWPVIALALFGRFALYEYTVMARNYGISMLILFTLAALYRRCRDAGWVLGLLLMGLCNTNVHSVALAAAFLVFWAVDLAGEHPIGWTRPWRGFLVGAALAAVGALMCVLEVYPPFNDAAQAALLINPDHSFHHNLLKALGRTFDDLAPKPLRTLHLGWLPTVLLAVGLLRWVRVPGALLAGGAGLTGLFLIFSLVYEGAYRHEALILPFLLTIGWLAAEGRGGAWPTWITARLGAALVLRTLGTTALALLLALQVVQGVAFVSRGLRGMPESRSAELAQLLRAPDLKDAVVMGDPDYNLEALPYYVPNPLYFAREHRFGLFALFSKAAKRTVNLGDVLGSARAVQARTGRPVVMVMSEDTFRDNAPGVYPRGYYGDFAMTAREHADFMAATRRIADFGRVAGGDESYAVFVLKPLSGPAA